jgi:hypothetical protein
MTTKTKPREAEAVQTATVIDSAATLRANELRRRKLPATVEEAKAMAEKPYATEH